MPNFRCKKCGALVRTTNYVVVKAKLCIECFIRLELARMAAKEQLRGYPKQPEKH